MQYSAVQCNVIGLPSLRVDTEALAAELAADAWLADKQREAAGETAEGRRQGAADGQAQMSAPTSPVAYICTYICISSVQFSSKLCGFETLTAMCIGDTSMQPNRLR